jgi:hypothetical protein
MSRNKSATAQATDPSTISTPEAATKKPRVRRSVADRMASAIDLAVASLAKVEKRAKPWIDASRDADHRASLLMVSEMVSQAHSCLKNQDVAKLIRDYAPASARVTDFEVGMLVKVVDKFRAALLDAVDDPSDLDEMSVHKVNAGFIVCNVGNGNRVMCLRTQIEALDATVELGDDSDDESAENAQ